MHPSLHRYRSCALLTCALLVAGCGAMTGAPRRAQTAAERFRIMPPQDEVVGRADWYRPRMRVVGVNSAATRTDAASGGTSGAPKDSIERFGAALAAARRWDSLAVVVLVDGRVVLEDYAAGVDANTQFDSQSMHRGLLALAVLAAREDGAIRSLAQPLADFIPEWRAADDARGRIRLSDLLHNQSGFVDPPYEFRADSPGMQLFIGDDLRGLVLAQRPTALPGKNYRGTALDAQLLGLVLERATGEPYAKFLSRRLWRPLGAGEAWVRLDRDGGGTRTFCCLQATARDWARVGELVRRGGIAQVAARERRILTADSVAQLLAPAPLNRAVGMSWFLEPTSLVPRSVAGDRPLPVPTAFDAKGVVYAGGRGGQRVYVLPAQNAVVVRIGRIRNDFDDGAFLNPFIAALAAKP
jgi:hypothetical protein